MKTNKLILSLLLSVSILFTACIDIEVSTVLNADGSLDRIIEVNSDSELKDYEGLPFPIDSTWNVKYELDTTKNKEHRYVFKKHYPSVNKLNADYENVANSLNKFKRKVTVNKRFRWFYTYISYDESYEKFAKGDYRPFNQYLSDIEKEARNYKNTDSLENLDDLDKKKIDAYLKDIDKKFEKWFEDNLKEEVMYSLEQDIVDYKLKGISIKELRAKSDTIYSILDSIFGQKEKDSFYWALNGIFNTQEFTKIAEAENSSLDKLEKLLEYIISQEGFKYNLQVPGLLIDANTENIKGNQLTWQFEPVEAFFVATSQNAESRIINLWAFWVSGIFLLVVVFFLLIPVIRK